VKSCAGNSVFDERQDDERTIEDFQKQGSSKVFFVIYLVLHDRSVFFSNSDFFWRFFLFSKSFL
jgi:hypothetical protein